MPRRTIKTMAIAFIVSSTTPSRAVTFGRAKPMFTDWPKSAPRSSTSALHKGFPLRARTVASLLRRPQVSRTFYARGQTGQRLLLGTYQALSAQIATGQVKMYPRTEMLDLVIVDGHAKGIVVRDMVTGEIRSHAGDAVLLCTGGYGNVFYLSTNAKGCNHGRVWVPKRKEDCSKPPHEIPEEARDGEALRDDENYSYVSAWKFEGEGKEPTRLKEPLVYEQVKLATRSYK